MTADFTFLGFGERLRRARIANRITGLELGKGCGPQGTDASKASVSDWENNRHFPKADQLHAICQKLGLSADYLLFGKGSIGQGFMRWANDIAPVMEKVVTKGPKP